MRPDFAFIFSMLLVVAMIAIPWLIFALAALFDGFPRLRLQQVLGIVGASAWIFAFIASLGPHDGSLLLLGVTTAVILLSFAGMWSREFRLLILRRADEFPDRADKLAWVAVLTLIAPAGVWLFRSYRRERWPETIKGPQTHPLDSPEGFEEEVAGLGESASHRLKM